MQASVARIARLLSHLDNTSAEICALSTNCPSTVNLGDSRAQLTSLLGDRQTLTEPLYNPIDGRFVGGHEIQSSREERFRLSYLQILRHVQEQVRRAPQAHHVLLSFYLTEVGFVTQQVALAEQLPHIATIRGSDYSRGFFCPDTIGAIEYVLRRADHIVATNEEQRRSMERFFGVRDKVTVIYNSVSRYPAMWKPKRRPYVQLFSDAGYAYKKGTHILFESFKQLRSEGRPLKLCVVGSTIESERAFWDRARKETEKLFPGDVTLLDYMAVQEIETYLGDSDIYASATLGEGCSQARTRALLTGMPIVTTLCGEIADLSELLTGCYTARCGDIAGYTNALRDACVALADPGLLRPLDISADLVSRFSEDVERRQWNHVMHEVKALPNSLPQRFGVSAHE